VQRALSPLAVLPVSVNRSRIVLVTRNRRGNRSCASHGVSSSCGVFNDHLGRLAEKVLIHLTFHVAPE
jgi:hypothetical protein